MGWNGLNLVSTIGAFLLAAGVLLFAVDLCAHPAPARAHGSAIRGTRPTLEWLPSEDYGNRSIARESAARNPLWDQPELAREVDEGRHYLPHSATGRRETIATSPLAAEPRYLLVLPGDSWLPLLGAAGTAAFFLLLTVKLYGLAAIGGVVAVGVGAGLAVGVGPPAAASAGAKPGPRTWRLPVGA
jgi:cytochrome c oxidase subunit I+III